MEERTTNLEKALDIIQGFLTFDFDTYFPYIKAVLYSIGIDKSSLPIIKLYFKDDSHYALTNSSNADVSYWKYDKSNESITTIAYPKSSDFDENNTIFTRQKNTNLLETIIGWAKVFSLNNETSDIDKDSLSFIDQTDQMTMMEFVKSLRSLGDDAEYYKFCANLQLDFYYYYNKSILNAEYLLLPNYSDLLRQTIKKFEDYIGIGGSGELPKFIESFLAIATQTEEMCWRIKQAIDKKNNRKIDISYNVEEYSKRYFPNQRFIDTDDRGMILYRFTQSVIEMTSIDHIHYATTANINSLFNLWDRIEQIEEINIVHNNINQLLKLVKAKTATILYKMVVDIGDDKSRKYLNIDNFDFFFNFGPKNSEELKEEIKNAKIPFGLNKTIDLKTNQKDKKITIEQLEKANPKFELPDRKDLSDIIEYNKWIEKGQNLYVEKSSIIELIQNKSESIDKKIDAIKEFIKSKDIEPNTDKDDIECFSPFFFICAIHFVIEHLKNKKVDKDHQKYDLLRLMAMLLSYLEQYIQTYTHSMPPLFRTYFEHSFYYYDDNCFKYFNLNDNYLTNYNYNNYETCFFFASYYCNPISINRLRDFYEKSLLQFQSFSTELTQEKESIIENTTRDLDNKTSEITAKQQELDTTTRNIEKHQHNSIQVLGLFTAFLSFIVTTVATFRVVNNLWEYIIYSLTYTLAIVLFAFLISDHTAKHYSKQEISNKHKRCLFNWGKYIAYVVVFVFLLVLSIVYFIINKPIKTTQENTNGLSITIDNSSTPNSTVNLNDITPNKTDIQNNATNP